MANAAYSIPASARTFFGDVVEAVTLRRFVAGIGFIALAYVGA